MTRHAGGLKNNSFDGMLIGQGVQGNFIGPGNVISGNVNNAIEIGGATTTNNQIFKNFIGTDGTGTVPLPR